MSPICCWFLFCTNVAIGTSKHAFLGDVPVCGRCAAKLGLVVTEWKDAPQ